MRSGVIIVVVILVALFFFSRGTDGNTSGGTASGSNSSTTGHLSVVPTIRSVTVSPGSVQFGDCTGGNGATNSTQKALGYPNGSCSVGLINETFPISVTYTGLPGQVYVQSTNAVPSDSGTQWNLCAPSDTTEASQGQTTCTGTDSLPGNDQYMIENFAADTNASVLTSSARCDEAFDTGGGCTANPAEFTKQTQHEGLMLTGPATWDDHSTSWTMTITWYAHGS